MRIAVFIKRTTYHAGYGGLETQNKLLCEGLAERGHDITVFSPKFNLEFGKKTERGVDYVFIDSVFRTLFSGLIKSHWYNKSYEVFKKHYEDIGFDLVVSQSSAGIGVMKHKEEFNIPFVAISHGSVLMEVLTRIQNVSGLADLVRLIPDVGYSMYNILFKQRVFIGNSDMVVTVSNFVKRSLVKETLCNKDKFVVIHNGVDPSKFDDEDVTEGTNLLYVGQIHKSKGIDYLVKLAEDEKFSDTHIDIVGGGEHLDWFRNIVSKKGLNAFFTIHGKLDYEKVLFFYKKAYVFLFPTRRYEGFPMVLVEAMFNGLPIIGFNKGGVGDAIGDGKTGYLIRKGNFSKFKKRLSSLIDDIEKRNTMGKLALEKAQKEFTIEHMLDKYEKVFEEVVK